MPTVKPPPTTVCPDSSIPWNASPDGQIAFSLDATSAAFGVSPHLSLDGDLVEYIASLLGAAVVLIVGSIWRKRKLKQLEQLALPPAAKAVRATERP
jgi:hypothetical protein